MLRGSRNAEANRTKANERREEGDRTRLHADEQAANAASADARAAQARDEAEKLQLEATERTGDVQAARDRAQEHRRWAMELDPDRQRRRVGEPTSSTGLRSGRRVRYRLKFKAPRAREPSLATCVERMLSQLSTADENCRRDKES